MGPIGPREGFQKSSKPPKLVQSEIAPQIALQIALQIAHQIAHLEGPTLSPDNGLGWYRDCLIRVSMIVSGCLNTF